MRFRCLTCRGNGLLGTFEFEADRRSCPKCGESSPSHISVLVDVHLMQVVPDGNLFAGGKRHRVACQPKRETLGVSVYEAFSATPDPRAVTCPSCKTTRAWKEAAMAYPELRVLVAMMSDGFKITGDGCCG